MKRWEFLEDCENHQKDNNEKPRTEKMFLNKKILEVIDSWVYITETESLELKQVSKII